MSELTKALKTRSSINIRELPYAALKELQGLLVDAGYAIAVDGLYGPKTRAAFATFKASVFQKDPEVLGGGSLGLLRKEATDRKTGKSPTEAVRAAATNSAVAPAPVPSGKTTKMLPSGTRVFVEDPVIPGGAFTWGEFTKNGSRWPVDRYTEGNLIRLAQQMQHVRKELGDVPIIITSAYRPPAVNRAVGGATASRHVHADAVDFYCPSLSIGSVHARIEPYWGNRGGCAVSYGGQFIHLDLRGHLARWIYG